MRPLANRHFSYVLILIFCSSSRAWLSSLPLPSPHLLWRDTLDRSSQETGMTNERLMWRRSGIPRNGVPSAVLHSALCAAPRDWLPRTLARAAIRPRCQNCAPPAKLHGACAPPCDVLVSHSFKAVLHPLYGVSFKWLGSSVLKVRCVLHGLSVWFNVSLAGQFELSDLLHPVQRGKVLVCRPRLQSISFLAQLVSVEGWGNLCLLCTHVISFCLCCNPHAGCGLC